ncbi:hypothetical protein SSX86_025755 [Deinandra increscens subsp. villosa]|uniref:Uncharacterized protein n=1 Tax=Deinandra increscens subsp. villosa TaxID=3103831 RepID=A0AAP0GMF0_9ASTR
MSPERAAGIPPSDAMCQRSHAFWFRARSPFFLKISYKQTFLSIKQKQKARKINMASQLNQANADQSQLSRDAATSQQPAQNAGVLEQTENSVKTMAQGAADVAGGAASGVMGVAKGAATGAANVAEGAAGAVKNTLGGNQGS